MRLKQELHLWDSKSSDSGGQVIEDSSESGESVCLVVFHVWWVFVLFAKYFQFSPLSDTWAGFYFLAPL